MIMTLPTSWGRVEVGELAKVVGGGTPPAGVQANFAVPGAGTAWLTPADLSGYRGQYISRGARDLSPAGLAACAAKILPKGALLFSSRAPVGYVAIAAGEVATNQGFRSFVFGPGVDPRFAYYQLRHLKPVAEAMATGTTFKELSGSVAAKLPFIVAPLREQKRIADKLDTVVARVDACRDRLTRVAPLLKRFRQSVLAAATSGRLTEDWRERSGTSAGSWLAMSVGQIAEVVDPHPSHRTPAEVPDGVPYVSIGDVDSRGNVRLGSARRVHRAVLREHQARYTVSGGDFIFGKIGTIGRPAKLPVKVEYTISANVLLIQPNRDVTSADFAFLLFSSPGFMASVVERSAATSQAAFGIKKMRETLVRVPPRDEQSEIVRRVETLFAFADRLETRLAQAQTAIDRLTPSLLAKAFRGELVPQDPADEPAAELLKRLAARRAAAPPKARTTRRSQPA